MITIRESTTSKLPSKTSLFVSFDYNPRIVEAIKLVSNAVFAKRTKLWEVPLTSLAELLDKVCLYDDVKLEVLPDEQVELEEITLPKFKSDPFDYQIEGIKYGLQHDSFLLLDAPGLGKSLQAMYIAQERKRRNGIEHCLIVCGVNTLKFNWKAEIEKHTDLSCRILGQRVNKKGRLVVDGVAKRIEQLQQPIDEFFVITNIESFRSEKFTEAIVNNKYNHFEMCVADEIHKMKDASSVQSTNFAKLKEPKYRIGLTGTLLLNSPLDSYVPLSWTGIDRSTYTNFKYYFGNFSGPFHNIPAGYKNIRILKQEIEENSLRRTKDILPNLPPKVIINEFVDMNDEQQKFYDDVKNGVIESADKVDLSNATVLSLIGRLRQATACPSFLTTENIKSSKVERCCDLVEQVCSDKKSKVVIFSVYKETASVLFNLLQDYHPLLCTGDVDDSIIDLNKKEFQENDYNMVMICTTSKMGTGHTLNRAETVIFIDTPYTNADYEQCQDRCHRIGTKDKVTIYNLICKETIDEHVLEIVEDKQMISDYILDGEVPDKVVDRLRSLIEDL